MTRPPFDPDPRYVEPEPLAPRRLDEPAPAWFAWFGLGICVGILLMALVVLAGAWFAASRSAPDPTAPQPGASDAIGSVDALARALASASGPELSGAPHEREGGPAPGSSSPMDRHDGGAPPSGGIGTAVVGGYVTWFESPGHTAAAGPLIREALGDWRGKLLTVRSGARQTVVRLTDSCRCGERAGLPTLLDLSPAAFQDLAPLDAGVVAVEIELTAVDELPPTDVGP